MRHFRRAAVIATTVLAIAASSCASGGETQLAGQVSDPAPEPAEPVEGEPGQGGRVAAYSAETELGEILVDSDGMTLYGFTNDTDGQSVCYSTCAEVWPPLTVGSEWIVGPELDSAIFNGYTRDDGTEQLVAGPWPLYRFEDDTEPGDINGQGSGGVWYVVSAEDGSLIQDEPGAAESGDVENDDATEDRDVAEEAPDVQVGSTDLGEVLTDAEGLTLYGFTEDTEGCPTCIGECAGTWPALLVEDEVTLAEGLDPSTFSTTEGAEGGIQVKGGKWPLYRFSGDSSPGDVNGQGIGGVWFAVAPDGSLIELDSPPPADDGADDGMDGMDGGAEDTPPADDGMGHMDHGGDDAPPADDSNRDGGY